MSNTRELLSVEKGSAQDKWVDLVEAEVLYLAPNLRHTPLLLATTVKEVLNTLRYDGDTAPVMSVALAKDISDINSRIGRNQVELYGEAVCYLRAIRDEWHLLEAPQKENLQKVCIEIAQLGDELSADQREKLNALLGKTKSVW